MCDCSPHRPCFGKLILLLLFLFYLFPHRFPSLLKSLTLKRVRVCSWELLLIWRHWHSRFAVGSYPLKSSDDHPIINVIPRRIPYPLLCFYSPCFIFILYLYFFYLPLHQTCKKRGSWIPRNISQNPQIEEHFMWLPAKE